LTRSGSLFTASHAELNCEPTTDNSTGSESESLYDWRFTANQFVLATSLLRTTSRISIFQLKTCGYSPYVTWVCRSQLLLVLANAIILRSESRGTHDHILLSQILDPPNLEGQEQGDPVIPQALGSVFVASYESHRYGGDIRPYCHTFHRFARTG
jgi:hypothetical protein